MQVKRILCAACLAAVLLFSFVCATVPACAETVSYDSLSLGFEGRENNREMSAAEIYEAVFGKPPTPAEGEWLLAEGISLRYNDTVPASSVSTDYDAENGILNVTVKPFRYTAENGTAVTWTPTGITVEGKRPELIYRDGVYTVEIKDLFRTKNFDIQVDFAWSATVSQEIVAHMQNGAYLVGSEALAEQAKYLKSMAEYEKINAEYAAWQAYLAKKQAYEAYLEALAAYQAQVRAYDSYVEAKALYDAELSAYLAWQDYYSALSEYTLQYEKYTAYQSYLTGMETVEHKLSLMESIYRSDSHKWNMYSSIIGGNVTKVISNKEELVNILHCNADDVDLAGDSTEALRVLLKGYYSLRREKYPSTYEKNAALYTYFAEHYEELQLHFTNLYMTLKEFLTNTFVERTLQSEGHRDHYLQFVGQLYVISTALDAEGERKADWTVGGKKLEEVVEACHLIPDGDWDPRLSSLPAYAEKTECPAEVPVPEVAMPSQRPIPPETVPSPGDAPKEVENPDDGEIPPRCDTAPEAPPVAPVFDELTLALMEEVQSGALKKNEADSASFVFSFFASVVRPVSIANRKLVSFYDIDGTLLHQTLVEYGSSVFFTPPEHSVSPEVEYRLLGWIGAEGNEVDLNYITSDLDVYPKYETVKKNYTVTWRVTDASGRLHEASSVWSYGATPIPDPTLPTASYEQDGYVYEFSGWGEEILPVTADVIYEGEITKRLKVYTVTWVVGETRITESVPHGALPIFQGSTELVSSSAEYTFRSWLPAVSPVVGDVTYTAQYDRHPYATSGKSALDIVENDTRMTVNADFHASVDFVRAMTRAKTAQKEFEIIWESGYSLLFDEEAMEEMLATDCKRIVLQVFLSDDGASCEVHFYNGLLENVRLSEHAPVLTLPYQRDEDGRQTAFFLSDQNGEESRIEGNAILSMGNESIRMTYVYPMSVSPNPNCNTGVLGYDASPGEVVSLRVDCMFGYELVGATVTDAAGNVLELEGLSFVMPNAAVSVTLAVEKIYYRVVFRCDGAVLSDVTYSYGDAIVLPPTPAKAETADTVYTFVSWGKEIPSHAGGAERELIFDALFSEQTKNIDYDTGHNNNLLAEVILPVVAVSLLTVVVAIILVVFILRRKHSK